MDLAGLLAAKNSEIAQLTAENARLRARELQVQNFVAELLDQTIPRSEASAELVALLTAMQAEYTQSGALLLRVAAQQERATFLAEKLREDLLWYIVGGPPEARPFYWREKIEPLLEDLTALTDAESEGV